MAKPPTLKAALTQCVSVLEHTSNQKLPVEGLEVAALDRSREGRKFRRLSPAEITQFLSA
jgi:proteasome alpha subunit